MKGIFILTLLFVGFNPVLSQTDEEYSYLLENSYSIDLDNPEFQFEEEFYSNDLFFFGFIHGSEKPQVLDLELLKTLQQHGIRYYAPEVDYSLAYFFNQYLITGEEAFLDFACESYLMRVPQDASIQFRDKWKKVYAYNEQVDKGDRIIVLGFDKEYSAEITLTHLAFIAPEGSTGISVIDSLKHFRNFEIEEANIMSGGPVYKSGKDWEYFFATKKSKHYERFKTEYEKDSLLVLSHFGIYANDVRHLMSQSQNDYRDYVIFNNFIKLGLPLIKGGGKIYSNYGYFHIQQGSINGAPPLAKLIKDSCDINLISLIGMMTNSECVKRKVKSDGRVVIKGVKFRNAKYGGYKASRSYDGDGLFEKVNGMKVLEKISGANHVMLFNLSGKGSPFNETMRFANFSRGGKNWKVDSEKAANDYFQYIILIKNSKSNIPLEELDSL